MMSKKMWLIEPHDSLIVRDGRPFGVGAGNRAESLQFPFPSTIVGAIRTRIGFAKLNGNRNGFSKELAETLQQKVSICGPLLAEIKNDDVNFLVPASSDCLIFESRNEDKLLTVPLKPLEKETGFFNDLNDEISSESAIEARNLHLCGLETFRQEKQAKTIPYFWRWKFFEEWLTESASKERTFSEIGIEALKKDRRLHTAIDYKTKAADEGKLFETLGLEFISKDSNSSSRDSSYVRYAIDYGDFDTDFNEGIAPLGGERRLAFWKKIEKPFPACPNEIKKKILREKHCRLVLLTPAIFEQGFLPADLVSDVSENSNLTVEVKAVAVNRYQVISGWDFRRNKPKATRRLCPAGAVFFLKLNGDDASVANWIEKRWFSCVSESEQDRKDGFGLAALGTWNGKFLKISEVVK